MGATPDGVAIRRADHPGLGDEGRRLFGVPRENEDTEQQPEAELQTHVCLPEMRGCEDVAVHGWRGNSSVRHRLGRPGRDRRRRSARNEDASSSSTPPGIASAQSPQGRRGMDPCGFAPVVSRFSRCGDGCRGRPIEVERPPAPPLQTGRRGRVACSPPRDRSAAPGAAWAQGRHVPDIGCVRRHHEKTRGRTRVGRSGSSGSFSPPRRHPNAPRPRRDVDSLGALRTRPTMRTGDPANSGTGPPRIFRESCVQPRICPRPDRRLKMARSNPMSRHSRKMMPLHHGAPPPSRPTMTRHSARIEPRGPPGRDPHQGSLLDADREPRGHQRSRRCGMALVTRSTGRSSGCWQR